MVENEDGRERSMEKFDEIFDKLDDFRVEIMKDAKDDITSIVLVNAFGSYFLSLINLMADITKERPTIERIIRKRVLLETMDSFLKKSEEIKTKIEEINED